MAGRLPIALAFVFCALLGGVRSECRADIGFTQAAQIAQIFNPGRTLVSMRRRTTNQGLLQYNTGFIDAKCTIMYGVDIHGTTGAVIGVGNEALLHPENLAAQDVMAALPTVTVSFEQALALMRAATGRPDSSVERIDLSSELFMIFYVVQYIDGSVWFVHAVTGEVWQGIDLAQPRNSISPATYWSRIERAYELSGAGSDWYPIFGATGWTDFGVPVGITLLNRTTGRVIQVDMLGSQHQVVEFMPVGHLLQVTSGLQGVVANTAVSSGQFLAVIQQSFPGGKLADLGLQARVNNGGLEVTWNATVLTAAGISVAFSVDAMQSGGSTGSSPHPDIPGDFNCDDHVTGADLSELLQHFGDEFTDCDIDGDGFVKGEDLAILLGNWG